MPDVADESGFPRQIGRSLGQPEAAVLVARKRVRARMANDGDLVLAPVNADDQPIVEATSPQIVGLLKEIRDQLTTMNLTLAARLR